MSWWNSSYENGREDGSKEDANADSASMNELGTAIGFGNVDYDKGYRDAVDEKDS
jgi:hypothetical protein